MKRKSTNKLSAFLSSTLILLLVAFVVGFLFYFTNNFTSDVKSFYVKIGNQNIVSYKDNFDIELRLEKNNTTYKELYLKTQEDEEWF